MMSHSLMGAYPSESFDANSIGGLALWISRRMCLQHCTAFLRGRGFSFNKKEGVLPSNQCIHMAPNCHRMQLRFLLFCVCVRHAYENEQLLFDSVLNPVVADRIVPP